MENFINFEPILSSESEDVKKYYLDNNLPIWDNSFFKNYIKLEDDKLFVNDEFKNNEPVYISEPSTFNEYDLNQNKFEEKSNNPVENEILNLPIDSQDRIYLRKLAKKESNFDPNIINQFGYQGLYQFGNLALQDIGFTKDDLKDTKKQHEAALLLAQKNDERLKDILDKYEGKEYKGVTITKNGIRAAAHLLGASTVKDWFNNTTNTPFSKKGFVDRNGTHITEYLSMF